MCGISGIISKQGKSIEPTLIKQLNQSIIHRGPDSSGYLAYKNIAFGHQRLSIIDLSDDGKQPMSYQNKYVITYNGEIYNYLELREILVDHGYTFTSQSDTEVILAAYDYWGKDCINHFNGMWAFALLDKKNDEVFISRDRFGVKPVYYYDGEDYFAFGSEIKQLLPLLPKITADEPVLIDYLVSGMEDHLENTFFTGIKKLPSAHSFIYRLSDNLKTKNQYFDLVPIPDIQAKTESESVALYKKTFIDSIKLRLRSDVKVGTCLSGGLDSSSIAYYASKLYASSENFLAFHVSTSKDSKYNELPFVKELIKDIPIDLVIIDGSKENVIKNIDNVIKVQEEPFGSVSVVLQYLLMEKAKSMNCKVLLDGQGGDESLLGYERYYPSIFLSLKSSQKVRFLKNVIKKSKLNLISLLGYIFYFTNSFLRIKLLRRRNTFINAKAFALMNKEIFTTMAKNYRNIFDLQRQELFSTQLPHLLRYEDKNSMFFSIETRLPFLDYRNIQNAVSINPLFKIKDGWSKYILRKSIDQEVPSSIVWRKNKIGFELPENEIINFLEPELKQLLEKSPLTAKLIHKNKLIRNLASLDNRTKWRLYNIVKWEEIFKVKVLNEK
jgi:asparagine synthase (glutamine-hydrolysing)